MFLGGLERWRSRVGQNYKQTGRVTRRLGILPGDPKLPAHISRGRNRVRAMAAPEQKGVLDFHITRIPCQHWQNQAGNNSRKKMSGKAYEIQIRFVDRVERDKMVWLSKGAGRDCYRLDTNQMVLKWFHEAENKEYKDLHSGEYSNYHQYATMAVGKHLPYQYAHGHREVMNAANQLMTVDCQLSEYVGPTLVSVFQNTRTDSPEVARHFVRLLLMIQRFMEANIAWESDFHTANICYQESSGVMKHVDLERFEASLHKP